jgi:hypothetical protein
VSWKRVDATKYANVLPNWRTIGSSQRVTFPWVRYLKGCQKNRMISLIPRLLAIFHKIIYFLRWGVVSTSPNPEAGEPPLVGCPRLLFQHILSYPAYLEAVPRSVTRGRAMQWWHGPTYHCERDPLISVTGTHLSVWQGPTYQWQGLTYYGFRE